MKTSASYLLLPKEKRISIALGLSAVLLKPIKVSHSTASQSSTVQLKDSTCTRTLLDSTWTAPGQRTVARYMTCTKNATEKKKIISGFSNYFLEEAAPIDKEVADNTLDSVKLAAASTLKNQDLYDPPSDDRRINPTAVESEVLAGEAAGDLESVTNTGPARTYASGKPLHGKLEETADGSMSQGRGSRVLKAPNTDAEVQSSAMQRKLTQMWDCLQVHFILVLIIWCR